MGNIVLSYQAVMQKVAQGKAFLDFFVYLAETGTLAAAARSTDTVQIEADSMFILDKISVFADVAGGAQTESSRIVPLVTMAIKDTGSGRDLQQEPIPLPSIAGNGELPFVLPQPRVFQPNSSVSFSFENFSAGTTYENVYISLIGRKLFEYN